jgi:hypothetical protein
MRIIYAALRDKPMMMHHELGAYSSGRGMGHHGFWASDTTHCKHTCGPRCPAAMFRAELGVNIQTTLWPNNACKLQSFPGFKRSKSSALHTCTWDQITPFSLYFPLSTHKLIRNQNRIGGSDRTKWERLMIHSYSWSWQLLKNSCKTMQGFKTLWWFHVNFSFPPISVMSVCNGAIWWVFFF